MSSVARERAPRACQRAREREPPRTRFTLTTTFLPSPPSPSYEKESGALNEALSDIMAVAAADWAHKQKRRASPPSWALGRELYPSNCDPTYAFLRFLQNPTADSVVYDDGYWVGSYRCWYPRFELPYDADNEVWDGVDVHYSSGPANRAFFLLATGLSCGNNGTEPVKAVGLVKARDVHYRALLTYLSKVSVFLCAC